jgi:hypothetical protein
MALSPFALNVPDLEACHTTNPGASRGKDYSAEYLDGEFWELRIQKRV